ncbi:MAG: PKD domain-containing protein, partial [Candidatus Thermoplasmatota archaeon]|nr:PKD domain-containing protein [Candidatus Thermoplasmatota archaeon]
SEGKVYGIDGATSDIVWTFNATGTSVWALAQIDDCTGDGIKDVIIGDYNAYGDVYGLDATTGEELFNSDINAQLILRFENIGDVNGDDHPDILPAHTDDKALIIDGYTGETIWSTSIADKSWCVANAQDISGDGVNDVFIGTTYQNNYCYFINGANGSIIESVSLKGPVDALTSTQDIIGDNSMELVAGIRDGTVLCISGGEVTLQPQPPTADFTVEPMNPDANQLVYFNSTSTDSDGYIVNWTWEMGDGTQLYDEQVTHSYPMNGTYQVNLTVMDDNLTTDTISKTISVGDLENIDVNQSVFDRGFPIRHAVDGDWAGAQNFTPTMSAITKAEIYLRKFGTPTFDLTVELRENDPEGTLLDSVTVPVGDVPTAWTWFEVDFADVTVSSGTDYFIVCPPAPSGVETSFGYEWGYAFGDQYPDGSFWFTRDGGNLWRDLPTMYEFVFKTFGY